MPNFTPEDLLLYNAGELENEKMISIEQELLTNWSLSEKFTVLREALARLNSIQLSSPCKQTVQAVMHYAMRKPVTV